MESSYKIVFGTNIIVIFQSILDLFWSTLSQSEMSKGSIEIILPKYYTFY